MRALALVQRLLHNCARFIQRGIHRISTRHAELRFLTKEELEARKLQLEIRRIGRSRWLAPALVLPLLTILVTAFLAWNSNWFDVRALELETKKNVLEYETLQLSDKRAGLLARNASLAKERTQLQSDNETLRRKGQEFSAELAALLRQNQLMKGNVSLLENQRASLTTTVNTLREQSDQLSAHLKAFEAFEHAVPSVHVHPMQADGTTPYAAHLQQRLGKSKLQDLLTRLRAIINLTNVSIALNELDDSNYEQLASLPRLTHLDISKSRLPGPVTISKFKKLENLSLVDSPLRKDLIADLRLMPELSALKVTGATVSDEHLAGIDGLRRLEALCVANSSITSTGAAHIAKCPRLKYLDLSNTTVDDTGIDKLAGIDTISTLGLAGTEITDQSLSRIATLPRLQHLYIARTGVTDEGLRELITCKSLQVIYLSQTGVTDVGLEHVARLPDLTTLDLRGTRISDRAIQALVSADRALEILLLSNTSVTGEGVKLLGKLQSLKVLDLGGIRITDNDIASLRGLTQLTHLNLQDTGVGPNVANVLSALPRLKYVHVTPTALSAAAMPTLETSNSLETIYVDSRTPEELAAANQVPHLLTKLSVAIAYKQPGDQPIWPTDAYHTQQAIRGDLEP